IGNEGILKLMKNAEKRDAHFHSVVAFCNPRESPRCFHGRAEGKISLEARGNLGFGFDPIFEPSASQGKTFAEMTLMEKNRHSHRAQALRKFARWYTSALQRRF
ncbi:non-canonical purine NTP pyrophosphatase, partial [Candidatus Bathyarchaeota archaeon]|nr:non-canonical purine NTP pyrophosphatase [Candidatus Bathyarchaeota archaeon]